ncbi:MAG: hypothetical protein FJ271_21620 [Planctomycetes bacterium]|nr:hypothetical protein [Planctomycetota bacterium]
MSCDPLRPVDGPLLGISSLATPPRRWSRRRRLGVLAGILLAIYVAAAYLMIPAMWRWFANRHPALDDLPEIAHTGSGIPGDPINVGLIGHEQEVIGIMLAAKWHPADRITLRSSIRIAAASVLHRPYPDAPVSHLYLWGRKEDLAFQLPVGRDPRQRHHVRFWRSEKLDDDGRPLWAGSVTFDRSVGISHRTGQITHHIAADVDAERDLLFQALQATGDLTELHVDKGFHKKLIGRNGGGDPWHTDGDLYIGVIKPGTPE